MAFRYFVLWPIIIKSPYGCLIVQSIRASIQPLLCLATLPLANTFELLRIHCDSKRLPIRLPEYVILFFMLSSTVFIGNTQIIHVVV